MNIAEVANFLEEFAPLRYQESYDNSGLIVGKGTTEVSGILVCLDSTEEIIEEATKRGCNLVVAHHPIVFTGLKKFNEATYVERTIAQAIRSDVAIYAIHTNLDNVRLGVNAKIAELLGLQNTRILSPKGRLRKLVTYCPNAVADQIRQALFGAGAGHIGNYGECSFSVQGNGTFKAGEGTSPAVGAIGSRHTEREERIEVVFPEHIQKNLLAALVTAHPYEEVAYDIFDEVLVNQSVGSGMIGDLKEPIATMDFLNEVKRIFSTDVVRYTKVIKEKISRVAVCGGSGSFLLPNAITAEADLFITADYKYHQFFDADDKLLIADIGHYESEQFSKELIADLLKEKFPKFAVLLTDVNTNPINYL